MASNDPPSHIDSAFTPSLNPFSIDEILVTLSGQDDDAQLFEPDELFERELGDLESALPESLLKPANVGGHSIDNSECQPGAAGCEDVGEESGEVAVAQAIEADDELIDEFADLEALLNDEPVHPATVEPNAQVHTHLQADRLSNSSAQVTAPLINSGANSGDGQLTQQPTSGFNSRTEEIDTGSSSSPTKSYGTIRVDVARLDNLSTFVGELVTQENTTALQNQQLQNTLSLTGQRLIQFEQIARELQDWIDQSQKSAASLPMLQHQRERMAQPSTHPNFDPLQMDSYNHLYTLVQSTMEEIAQQNEAMRDLMLISQQFQQTHQQKQQVLRQVRNSLLWVRMLPLGDILQRFPRMVRDMSAQCGKRVTVKLVGANTLVDKLILEKLFDPLVHLVRNAVDHGIELPAVRESKGKPAQATLEICAYHRNNQIHIDVQDDGRGIDVERIRARVVALNWASAEQADELTNEQLYEYLFSPGFSTAAWVNEISGRGVGLDAVRVQIKNLKGQISLVSEPGKGTTFTMRLPLTMNVADLLVFSIKNNLMAIAADTLVSIVSVPLDQLQTQQDRQFYQWQDQLIPIHPQQPFLQHYPLPPHNNETFQAIPLPQNHAMLLLIAAEAGIVALQVDQILQKQELVIKPFGIAVTAPPFLSGCTILGDGSLIPVINGQTLSVSGRETLELNLPLPVGPEALPAISSLTAKLPQTITEETLQSLQRLYRTHSHPTLLVVDDSLTARQMLAFTLEKAGYRVVQARDGQDALRQLRQEPAIRAVFCDVEMPRMNGFEFLSHCYQEFADPPPVIMVTSRAGDKHRQMAQDLGARFYLTKPYLEQSLMATLNQCLAELP